MLGVGYRMQFEPNTLECMRLAREKVLGDVKIIDANFGFAIGDPTQWRLKRALAGGGSLMDVGIYCLQTTRMITGEDPVWINASEVKTDAVKFKEVDETVLWQAKFPSGVVSNSICTYSANGLAGFRCRDHARLVRDGPGVFLQRQSRPAQRWPGDQSAGRRPVRHRARRLRRLHHQQAADEGAGRDGARGREVADGDLRVDQEGRAPFRWRKWGHSSFPSKGEIAATRSNDRPFAGIEFKRADRQTRRRRTDCTADCRPSRSARAWRRAHRDP